MSVDRGLSFFYLFKEPALSFINVFYSLSFLILYLFVCLFVCLESARRERGRGGGKESFRQTPH